MPSNRVLVVEDDPSVRGLLQTILEDEALEVILAADGEEGLELARTVEPDVVLLDVMMPGLGGPDVIRRLRRADGSLPFAVLVVTGAAEVIAPLRSELGPEAVLEKPSTSPPWPAGQVAGQRWRPRGGHEQTRLPLVDDVEPASGRHPRRADRHKADRRARDTIGGAQVALIFEKPSPRTRVSFEVAVHELGGYPLPLAGAELQLGRGETLEDTAAVLSRYVHAIVLRTFAQESLERLARGGSVPVVNALSDYSHPCQALADLQTIREGKGRLEGIRLAYLGDGNNVAHSLLFAGAKMGMHVAMATPVGYEPIPQVVRRASEIAAATGGSVELTHDPETAAKDADVLYTDVWASMGKEMEHGERALIFKPYQLSTDTVMAAAPDGIVMHCLPAHRGEEIAAEVMDGPNSAVFDQAENASTPEGPAVVAAPGSSDPS